MLAQYLWYAALARNVAYFKLYTKGTSKTCSTGCGDIIEIHMYFFFSAVNPDVQMDIYYQVNGSIQELTLTLTKWKHNV